jgi:dinuclear metal center YbgI/SA1388 family protein
MRLSSVLDWLAKELELGKFDDVSNNGLQIAREGDTVTRVAFGVDASKAFLEKAAAEGAELCVVHHGFSWGGGVKRITGGVYEIVKTALKNNLALYAAHLPLDANRKYGNNWEIARYLELKSVKKAFSYHGNIIGVTGKVSKSGGYTIGSTEIHLEKGMKVGVCSGGAGDFAEAAKFLGCDVFITGEASWGDVIAAENVGMKMIQAGHYETETFGVRALAEAMTTHLGVETVFIDRMPRA